METTFSYKVPEKERLIGNYNDQDSQYSSIDVSGDIQHLQKQIISILSSAGMPKSIISHIFFAVI